MALRSDLGLSEEQKDYIGAKFNAEGKMSSQREILEKVATNFAMTRQGAVSGAGANFNKVMQSFETLQNYILALSETSAELVNQGVLTGIQDLLRMLPTRDFEFNFLADFMMSLN